MRVASFFAGIGGFDLGFQNAGHQIVFQCEIDEFCNKILANHWPEVKRVKDIRELSNETVIPQSEIWCGGFPCQDVSVARGGPRAGLKGQQTGLFYAFAELIDRNRPPIVILENVPGLLSSHRGRDFGVILQTLASFGYSVGWRVLNSQYFGVPQSRQRLYIVGCLGNPGCAAEILFESERSGWDVAESRQPEEKPISPFKEVFGNLSKGPIVQRIAYCLAATSGRHTGTDWSRTYISYPNAVRRLTPIESERIQGFPTNWTLPPNLNGTSPEKYDGPRYQAIGNAVSVPVAEWIGHRISLAYEKYFVGSLNYSMSIAKQTVEQI